MATKDDITRGNTVRKAVDQEEGAALGGGAAGACTNDGADAGATAGANAGDNVGVEGVREASVPAFGRSVCDTQGDTLQDLRTRLAEHIETLQFVNGAISVCINALLQQNADMDADIALVLRRTVGDKLFEATERLELVALALEYGQVVEYCDEGETAAA